MIPFVLWFVLVEERSGVLSSGMHLCFSLFYLQNLMQIELYRSGEVNSLFSLQTFYK